jgi:hypothetical protein
MSRTIDQILAGQRLEISPHLIRTPESTISVGDVWTVQEYHWPDLWSGYVEGPSPFAISVLVGSVWLLANPVPADMPWLIPVASAAALGAAWSILCWLLNRRLRRPIPQQPTRGITFSVSGSEGAVTIFQSEDEQEIKLLRQKLESVLLPNA